MNAYSVNIETIITTFPGKPGVYQFYDQDGLLMYVGKAKNIKKRVASYFTKVHDSGRTTVMVKKIKDVKYIVVESELDALLLENNLIKKHQPRYNVMLKDDKTYPWICIKNERFPRIFSTRTVVNDGSTYFGPYASVKMINTLLDMIYQIYKLRNCSLALTEENIQKEKFRVCLEYHVGNCKGPCEGHQTETDYNETIAQIKEILKGNISAVINHLKQRMLDFADKFEFESAQIIKNKLDILEKFKSKSVIVNSVIHNVDVYSIVMEGQSGFVNFMKVINGAIVQSFTIELKKKLDETPAELLSFAIAELKTRYNSDAPEIIVPIDPEIELPGVIITIPKIGDKKHLLELSEKNTKYFIKEKLDLIEKLNPGMKAQQLLAKMQKELRLAEPPVHIECFDNSNMQGSFPVAAMTVFKNVRPSKKDYRLFNIRTVTGPNDFASMEEVIYRRYKRLLVEGQELPQLIIVDGGKGQLSAAMKSLELLGLRGKISILGIAKKLEELYYPEDPVPLYLDKKSETLKIIQQLRDEAHRFGITHHRKRRSKGVVQTELAQIHGIGDATAGILLKKFKSVKKIKEASIEEISAVVGKAKGELVYSYFKMASA